MSFVSTILFKLYRWSLRHSGPATQTEYEHTTKVPIKAEYIAPATFATIKSVEPSGAPATGMPYTWRIWPVGRRGN